MRNRLVKIDVVEISIFDLLHQSSFFRTIADEIRKDQVITARVLQLSNSALFAAKKTITTLDHAVVYLGQELLVKLVITAAIQSFYEQSGI